MATKSETTAATAVENKVADTEFVYSKDEFVTAAMKLFGVSPDIVTAAFTVNNLKEATPSEAKRIVSAFAKKEVK